MRHLPLGSLKYPCRRGLAGTQVLKSVARGMLASIRFRSVDRMDIASMIMGASIVSIAWIAFWPWAQLKRLRELEASAVVDPDQES